MKSVTDIIDSRCFEWFVVAKSINGIAVYAICVNEHIGTNIILL